MVATQRTSSSVVEEAQTDMTHTDSAQFIVPNFTDVVLLSIIVYAATYIPSVVEAAFLLSFALWNTYWFWSGLVGTGLWTINNAVGWVIHSALGVPYHSWRISHGRHHAATGHIARDEVFVPRSRDQLKYPKFDENKEDIEGLNVAKERQLELAEAIGDAPLFVLVNLLSQQLLGYPMYLIRNASGQKTYPKFTNHFNPDSVIFDKRHRNQIIASDVGIALLFAALGTWTHYRSFAEVATYYLVPYLWVNHWLVSITFLQHTDPFLPHYSNSLWTFPRGALATIDRNCLGFIGPVLLHGICETHVSHHISSKIPHYNAWKATDALKEFLGPHYQKRDDNFIAALYRTYRDCRFVDEGLEVVFFKNASGVAQMKGKFEGGSVSDSGVDMSADGKAKTN
ncbi:hypothetical protein BDY24DRAFT_404117 [Mrakia frigida]|uniref:uncharacterized protein n=1 Tax=Mrakia frigida TaxID=29902 RepID=UPI003FCBF64A